MPFIIEVVEVNGRCLAMIDVLMVLRSSNNPYFTVGWCVIRDSPLKPQTHAVSRPIYRLSFYCCRATTWRKHRQYYTPEYEPVAHLLFPVFLVSPGLVVSWQPFMFQASLLAGKQLHSLPISGLNTRHDRIPDVITSSAYYSQKYALD